METSERKALYRQLYNAARMCVHEHWRNDSDRVKEVRDLACANMYGELYDDLSERELINVINYLNIQNGTEEESKKARACASERQLRTLRYYAMACAIHYCEFPSRLTYFNDKSQSMISGEELRKWLRHTFNDIDGRLPGFLFRHLYQTWINPKSHTFLDEGGFRKFVKHCEVFYYQYLTPAEAQYLINRYRAISENLGIAADPRKIDVTYLSTN